MPATLVQITDCHLFGDDTKELYDTNTAETFEDVLGLIAAEIPSPDLVLATGDISHDGSELSYTRFLRGVARFHAPVAWIPGNHDDPGTMRGVARSIESGSVPGLEPGFGSQLLERSLVLGPWRLLLLDTHVPGKVSGELSASELAFLDDGLAGNCSGEKPQHVVIVLHHHAVATETWLDQHILENRSELHSLLDRHESVRAVVFGHIHQAFDQTRGKVRMLASPSTSSQFSPLSDGPALDPVSPGYRWITLHDDGSLTTGVSRLGVPLLGVPRLGVPGTGVSGTG